MYQLSPVRCMGGMSSKNSPSSLGDDAGPALADVAVEREGLVLGEDVNAAQAGVDAVGERDVDDAVVAAEGNGRLGAVTREREETFAGAAGQQHSECVFHIRHRVPPRPLCSDDFTTAKHLPQKDKTINGPESR